VIIFLTIRQQQPNNQLVHRDAAIVATKNINPDVDLKIVRKTESSKHQKQHAIRCESININVDDGQLTIKRPAGVRKELSEQFIPAGNCNPPGSTKAFDRTVHEIEHYNDFRSGIFADEFGDERPQEWTKQALKTLEKATELYMVEVPADPHSRSRDQFLVGFQHVSYYGKTRRLGTA